MGLQIGDDIGDIVVAKGVAACRFAAGGEVGHDHPIATVIAVGGPVMIGHRGGARTTAFDRFDSAGLSSLVSRGLAPAGAPQLIPVFPSAAQPRQFTTQSPTD